MKAQAAQAHYVWVRASEVIWSEYTRIITVLSAGADPGEVKWVNFHPPFSESLFNHADVQTSNTSTRLWFYYIITKLHPPFQNPGSAPDLMPNKCKILKI